MPETALKLNTMAETYRVQRGSLQLIVGKYNHIVMTMLDVEQPLLQGQLKAIDKALEKGQKHLTCEAAPHMGHSHTVHLPLGALLIWRTVCGAGGYAYYHIWQVEVARHRRLRA